MTPNSTWNSNNINELRKEVYELRKKVFLLEKEIEELKKSLNPEEQQYKDFVAQIKNTLDENGIITTNEEFYNGTHISFINLCRLCKRIVIKKGPYIKYTFSRYQIAEHNGTNTRLEEYRDSFDFFRRKLYNRNYQIEIRPEQTRFARRSNSDSGGGRIHSKGNKGIFSKNNTKRKG